MKIVERDAPLEKALQAVEDVMREVGIELDAEGGWLFVIYKGISYRIVDLDAPNHGNGPTDLPRSYDSYRLELV